MRQTRRAPGEEQRSMASRAASASLPTAGSADSRTKNSSDSGDAATAPNATDSGSLVSRIRKLSINRDDLTLRWAVAGGKPHWYLSRTRLTDQDLAWALEGRIYLGTYA